MSDELDLTLGQTAETAVGQLTVFNDGLPNTCSDCGELQEHFWLAAHRDASRAGRGLCPKCAGLAADPSADGHGQADTSGQSAETLGDPAVDGAVLSTDVNLTPGPAAQLLGTIPDEDLLVSGAAPIDGLEDTNEGPETAVEPAAEPTDADDLTRVRGIGPKMAPRLAKLGITTFRELAAADVDELDAALPVSRVNIADWVMQASLLAK